MVPDKVLHGKRPASSYRPDIDGMRAVAVLLVMLFHLQPALVPGGYTGVDMFFVISGFVVTSSVLKFERETAIAQMLHFWKRRIFRIYPALLVCLSVSFIATLSFTPPFTPEEYHADVRTGLSAIFGMSNIYLYKSSENYFSSDQYNNPFVHTWSLGVEEQFYLFFSLMFMLFPFLLGSIQQSTSSRATRLWTTGLFTALSFALWARSDAAGTTSYYLFYYRLWELGVGSLCAQSMAGAVPLGPANVRGRWFLRLRYLAMAGIVLLATAPDLSIKSSILLSVGLSLSLIVLDGAMSNSMSDRQLLSSAEFVGIGLISYSLYLWHWPIYNLFRLTIGLSDLSHALMAIGVTVIFAAASYFLIEKPMRYPTHSTRRRLFALALISVLCAALGTVSEIQPGMFYLGSHQEWARDWLPPDRVPYLDGALLTQRICDLASYVTTQDVPQACQSIDHEGSSKLPLLTAYGDSLSFSDWGMVAGLDRAGRARVAALSRDGCGLDTVQEQPIDCLAYWRDIPIRVRMSGRKGDIVFVAFFWRLEASADHSAAFLWLKQTAEAARDVGATLIVQAPLPQFGRDAFFCTREWFRLSYDGCSASTVSFTAARKDIMTELQSLHDAHLPLTVWDPVNHLCSETTCAQIMQWASLFTAIGIICLMLAPDLSAPLLSNFYRRTICCGCPTPNFLIYRIEISLAPLSGNLLWIGAHELAARRLG